MPNHILMPYFFNAQNPLFIFRSIGLSKESVQFKGTLHHFTTQVFL